MRRLLILLSGVLLVGCAVTPADRYGEQVSARVQAPSSQEAVKSESTKRAKAHTDLGFEYYAQKQFGTALQEAKVALSNDSSYVPAHNLRALVAMALADYKIADESFQRALQLAPNDPEIANNYGWFLCQTKHEDASFAYFNRALENPLYPTPVVALSNAGECAMKRSDYAASEGYLQRAVVREPDNSRVLFLMASLKYRQQQFSEADTYIQQLHRVVEPTAESLWLALRVARQINDRTDEARYLSLLRKNFPDSDEYRKALQGSKK